MDPQQVRAAEGIRRQPRRFTSAAQRLTSWTGSGWAVGATATIALVWMAVGAATGYPRAWELAVTAGLPFLTLLMLILIQHTQNHDDRAVQLKLDELIRASSRASNRMMTLEDASRDDLDTIRAEFEDEATR